MALPLPQVVPNTPEEGWILSGMKHQNALTKQNIENKYLPITSQADAASKLTYANLMGPQYMAKLMGNTDILANIPEEQKNQILEYVKKAGMSPGANNTLLSPPQSTSLLEDTINSVRNAFGFGQPQEQKTNQQQSPVNAFSYANQPGLSQQDRNSISNMNPGDSYVVQGNGSSPQVQQPQFSPSRSPSPTFAENTGGYKGVVAEGQESGKIRANDIKDLNTTVFNGQTHQTTLDNISNILASPEFEQIRQVPALGKHELSYYSKFGTPEQQNMVGQYYTLSGNLVKDSARDFAGQFRQGEQQLLSGMKPGPSDTVDTARGKTESLSVMNKMLTERSRITSEIMNKYHVNKLQAEEQADKEVNGEQIRQGIHDRLNPTITIRNKKTGETKTIPVAEARKLGVPNV